MSRTPGTAGSAGTERMGPDGGYRPATQWCCRSWGDLLRSGYSGDAGNAALPGDHSGVTREIGVRSKAASFWASVQLASKLTWVLSRSPPFTYTAGLAPLVASQSWFIAPMGFWEPSEADWTDFTSWPDALTRPITSPRCRFWPEATSPLSKAIRPPNTNGAGW